MFSHCYSLESIDISNFVTSNVVDINSMFYLCHSLTSINFNIKNFVTVKVPIISYLFSHCYSLTTIDISNFNTKNIWGFNDMFSHCYSITSINILHFDFYNYNSLDNMFSGCYSLTSIAFPNIQIRYYYGIFNFLFYDCPNLNLVNISTFDLYAYSEDLFNTNISSSGTLIISQRFYNDYIKKYFIPQNWKIIPNY